MSPSETPEIPPTALTQFFVGDCGLRASGRRSTFSTPPPSASGEEPISGLFNSLSRCNLLTCAPPWRIRLVSQPTETLTPELSTTRSPSSSSGMAMVATGQSPPAGLSPAGSSSSFAALPSPVLTLAFLRKSSRHGRGSSAGTHPPLSVAVYFRARPSFEDRRIPAQCPGPSWDRQVPRASLPSSGVTSAGVVSCTTSKGITPSSLLVLAHAPDQLPPASFGRPSVGGSLQVAASPCWVMALPDVSSAYPSSDARTRTPAARTVHSSISSRSASAFPTS